jgi:integron integrase
MKAIEAMALFENGMREERKARATMDTYRSHVRQFLAFRPVGVSADWTVEDRVSAYLSWVALNRAAATQAQALNAIVCFYRLIGRKLGTLPVWVRPKEKIRIPVWVTTREARAIIALLPAPADEVASMLFGSGLRITECLRLRVKDIDLERATVTIRGGKGDKDRVVMLAKSLLPVLAQRLEVTRAVWQEDRAASRPGVYLPNGLERKYPRAGCEWPWFWVWPAPGESIDPETGIKRRHHRCGEGFAKALKKAVTRAAVTRAAVGKRVTAHAFRHGFATAYLMGGGTVPELQELLGHANMETTEVYVHCLPQLASRVGSPLDAEETNISPMRRSA